MLRLGQWRVPGRMANGGGAFGCDPAGNRWRSGDQIGHRDGLVGGLKHRVYFSIGNFIIPTDGRIFLEGLKPTRSTRFTVSKQVVVITSLASLAK